MNIPQELHEIVREKWIVMTKNYTAAIKSDNLNLIKMLYKKGQPHEAHYIDIASKTGNLPVCQWFYKEFRNNSIRLFIHPAIIFGHRHILKWLCDIENYNRKIVGNVAADLGDIATLEWLFENYKTTIFEYFTFEYAINAKQWEAAKWLFNHACKKDCEKALKWGRIKWCNYPELVEWIRQNHSEIEIPLWFTESFEWIFEHRREFELETVLCHRQFPEEQLEKMVWYVNLNYFLKTQKVSLDFCVKYILNEEYYQDDNETSITVDDVIYYQGYTREEILEALKIVQVE